MRRTLLMVLVLGAALSALAQLPSPATMNAGGGSFNDPRSYIRYFDWSIGELSLINTVTSNDNSILVTQGVLQLYTEKPGLSYFATNFQSDDFKLFPNPTVGKFEIDFFLNASGIMDLELTDVSGKTLEKRSFVYGSDHRIEHYDISRLPAGIYFLIATLRPDNNSTYNIRMEPRRSGIRIVKFN